jgi:hypothetical protein
MATIRQLIHASPTKANELFARLAETSGNAVKTRERLFSELKEELELHMRLEEQHLFPVLKKHKETKELVSDALNDNKETRRALTQLERAQKDSEEFTSKVADLRKAFQQHVRDERKEFLPAVLKALDDEEAEAVVEKIEGAKAEVEQAKRAEADERRAAAREEREKAENIARQERERVETARQAAESIGNVVRVGAEAPRRAAETARDAVQNSVSAATQVAREATDFGISSFSNVAHGVQNAAAGMTAVAHANIGLAMRYQAIWREFLQLVQRSGEARTESVTRFMSVRSPQQLFDAHVDLFKGEFQRFFDGQARLSQLSAEAALDAKQRIEDASAALRQSGDAGQGKGRQTRHAA